MQPVEVEYNDMIAHTSCFGMAAPTEGLPSAAASRQSLPLGLQRGAGAGRVRTGPGARGRGTVLIAATLFPTYPILKDTLATYARVMVSQWLQF